MVTCGGPPRVQNRAIEFHDSKVLSWRVEGSDLRVNLKAYVHVSLGQPGVDRGTGWSQEVELLLRNAQVQAVPGETPLWITEGFIEAFPAES